VRIDIDEGGEHIERAVIERAGDTPIKVRTASRKLHLVYAYHGERRLTGLPGHSNARPWPDPKVDLCGGGGFSVSPPSVCNGGAYELLGDVTLEELLANRHQLPTIKGLEPRAYAPARQLPAPTYTEDLRSVGPGSRDAVFYRGRPHVSARVSGWWQ
jgi:bifunctional DNA primase/polymerase-like protein